jgi:uncharacterized YkwD family protein
MNKNKKTNKIFILIITLFMIIFNISNKIFAYDATNFTPEYGTTTTNVNLRKATNLNTSSVLFTIPQNTNIRIIGELNDFYIVQLEDNRIGLVSKQYVAKAEQKGNFLEYTNLDKYFATANSNSINLRGGPGTNFQIYGKLKENEKVEVLGKINDFLLIVTENNTVGMVREDLLTKEFNISNEDLKQKSNELLNLINTEREKNGLIRLEVLPRLEEIATLKAEDMVKNNYFAHESPTYGNPFEMMKNFGITYKTAGENIAGNSTVEGAFNAWINSESHKQNLLSTAYNYIGIGIAPSEKYGYVIVAMFIR